MTRIVIETNTLKFLVKRLINAEIAASWAGSQSSEERKSIDEGAKTALKDLTDYLKPCAENKPTK